MTPKEFATQCQKKATQIDELFRRRLPVVVGRMAKDHFQDNFRQGGFVNNGVQKWEPAKRLTSGRSGAAAKYPTLLSSRNYLFSSIAYAPSDGRVRIFTPVPYASPLQFGATLSPTVTPKMRKFAWARYYEAGGKRGAGGEKTINPEAERWKRLALTKKTKLSIRLPARPMIGESAELNQKVQNKIDADLRTILNL